MLDPGKLPFRVHLEIPGPEYEGEIEVALHLRTDELNHPLDGSPLTLDPSEELSQLFALAVSEGVLGGERPRMVLREQTCEPTRRVSIYEVRDLPWESFTYLLALLTQARHALDPLEALVVRPLASLKSIYTERDLAGLAVSPPALPSSHDAPRLSVTIDPTAEHSFELELEFTRGLSRREFERVRRGLALWDEIRVVGGFRLDLTEQEHCGPLAAISHRLPSQVALTVDQPYEGDLAAIRGLVGFGLLLAREGIPMTALRIE